MVPKPHQDLIAAFTDGKCGIFVGAGVSRSSGLPSWSELLSELIDKTKQLPNPDKALVKDLRRLLRDNSKHLLLASILKEELGADFAKYIEGRFGDDSLIPTPVHRELIELPAQFLITTNYDGLLERAFSEKHLGKQSLTPLTYQHAGEVASHLYRNRFFLLKAHGDAKLDPDGIVLTERDYRRMIYYEPGYQSLLQTLFTTYTIFFVGVSFTDIELNLLLSYIHSSFHGKTPPHYALMADTNPNPTLVKLWRNEFNIHAITVDPKGNYKEILAFVKKLRAALP